MQLGLELGLKEVDARVEAMRAQAFVAFTNIGTPEIVITIPQDVDASRVGADGWQSSAERRAKRVPPLPVAISTRRKKIKSIKKRGKPRGHVIARAATSGRR